MVSVEARDRSESVVQRNGETGFTGGARAGVQGDPAGRRMVSGQSGVRVDRVVVAVDDHGDRRWHGGRHGGVVVRQGG
ncbi:hypothetical protein [Streptomyces sp. OE57]|uniref:hypothetical protein n=1 Tax=Streptomyces lacaronensis TaxID=3379885 RepID=UPI0039B7524E